MKPKAGAGNGLKHVGTIGHALHRILSGALSDRGFVSLPGSGTEVPFRAIEIFLPLCVSQPPILAAFISRGRIATRKRGVPTDVWCQTRNISDFVSQ